jgi:hypothetical protein
VVELEQVVELVGVPLVAFEGVDELDLAVEQALVASGGLRSCSTSAGSCSSDRLRAAVVRRWRGTVTERLTATATANATTRPPTPPSR